MDFKIIAVYEQDCHLVLRVEHYLDSLPWYKDDYIWQGREGLKRKRKTNANGSLLMDNGRVAPLRDEEPYLPAGRNWARYGMPHMDDGSILETIKVAHRRSVENGRPYADGTIGTAKLTFEDRDYTGCSQLVAKFAHLPGNYDS